MTVPPGGPYGQGPYGSNPYGQDPYWGQQPPGGAYPQGGNYPQGGGYQQGGGYPYPPPGGTDAYTAAGYPAQQYAQPPQPYPGGSPYAPGPPPNGPRSKMPWFIFGGIALIGVIALVVILVVAFGDSGKSNPAATSAPTSAPTSDADAGAQSATDCTANVSGGPKPTGTTISAGKLSFPTSATPGWTPYSDDQDPNLIDAVGVAAPVTGANQWQMQAEVAITNFVSSMDVTAQATKLIACIANGPGYSNASPTLGQTKTTSTTVDGVKAARVEADVTIADTSRNVKGDTLIIIAVDTKPVTIFLGASPIGDAASAGIISQVIAGLKVAKT